jgi:hypothetical protein
MIGDFRKPLFLIVASCPLLTGACKSQTAEPTSPTAKSGDNTQCASSEIKYWTASDGKPMYRMMNRRFLANEDASVLIEILLEAVGSEVNGVEWKGTITIPVHGDHCDVDHATVPQGFRLSLSR